VLSGYEGLWSGTRDQGQLLDWPGQGPVPGPCCITAVKSGSGAGGAGAAAGRVVSGAAAEGRSTAAREQTRVM
jgi:hypothetical protein